jgi:hypothetical protein
VPGRQISVVVDPGAPLFATPRVAFWVGAGLGYEIGR